jgi:hypothetical protein
MELLQNLALTAVLASVATTSSAQNSMGVIPLAPT